MARETRKKWAELVARRGRSGLTANQFAGEAKINAGTLQYYKWLIGRDSRAAPGKRPRLKTRAGFVEVRTSDLAAADASRADDRIEVVPASTKNEPTTDDSLRAVAETCEYRGPGGPDLA